jgi:hypothetical protein
MGRLWGFRRVPGCREGRARRTQDTDCLPGSHAGWFVGLSTEYVSSKVNRPGRWSYPATTRVFDFSGRRIGAGSRDIHHHPPIQLRVAVAPSIHLIALCISQAFAPTPTLAPMNPLAPSAPPPTASASQFSPSSSPLHPPSLQHNARVLSSLSTVGCARNMANVASPFHSHSH